MGLDFPAAWNEQIRHVLVEFVDRHNPVMMEIEAVILSEHRQLLHTINMSEVTDQRALHSSPNQLQVVLVIQEDEEVEMTVINSDDIIPLHNSNELEKQIVDHEEDDLWHVDPLLTHIQNSDIEASLWVHKNVLEMCKHYVLDFQDCEIPGNFYIMGQEGAERGCNLYWRTPTHLKFCLRLEGEPVKLLSCDQEVTGSSCGNNLLQKYRVRLRTIDPYGPALPQTLRIAQLIAPG
ncbi:hypothetical protein KY285_017970 [Solanum tuberosum]|nr:hypothetical protein KY284_017959 [Solanum tuberosum]KAH0690768.1 hypothetical protein KY289_018126 [Solanum tuberosum]KAH0703692.1 hypothetical protein KY285_017970 [Solanum tuberosum]